MKIAVLGAGAVGSIFGARLSLGGADVTLLDVNQAHLDAINTSGLKVNLDGKKHVLKLPAMRPEDFKGSVDVVLLFTKIFHTDTALRAISGVLDTATVLSLQNGIGNAERISMHVPKEQIFLGMTMTPADFIEPGHVESHGLAKSGFYALDGRDQPLLHDLAAVMQSGGIEAKPDPNIQASIWEKASFNCAMNALCALSGSTPGSIGVSESGRALASCVAAEAISVAQASGVSASLENVENLMSHAYKHHLFHVPSMLQDRNAGRPTEIAALNGAIAELGNKLGIPVVVNKTISNLVHLMEDAVQFRKDNVSVE